MIEGQLAETREPQNVQVDIDAGMPEQTAVIRLRDEDRVFSEYDTPDERELSTSERESSSKTNEPETLDETETERQLEEQAAATGSTRMPTSADLRGLEDTAGVCPLSNVDPDGGGGVEHTRIRELERNLLEASERATRLETQMEFLTAHTAKLEGLVECERGHSSSLQSDLKRASDQNAQLREAVSMLETRERE